MTLQAKTFTDIILDMASRGSQPCFSYIPDGHIDPVETLSYAEVLDRSLRMAAALREHGARKGDRVAMFAQPSPDFLTTLLGAILIGVVPTPINHNFKQTEASDYLAYIDPRLVVCDSATREVLDAVMAEKQVPWLALEIDPPIEERRGGQGERTPSVLRWSDWKPAEPYMAKPDDLVMILHTSGTTALPKGVERTHKAVCSFINRWVGFAWREGDTMVSWHPFYHQSGTLTSAMSMIAAGGHTIQWQRFSASKFWDVANRHRPTVVQFVPPSGTYLFLGPASGNDRNHSIEYGTGGGRVDHWNDFLQRFGINGHTPYGSTETTYVTITGGRDDPPIPTSELLGAMSHFYAGRLIPDFLELRVMLPDGPAAPGEPGEIQVRGPAVFENYFRLPEVTAKAFDGDWFKTGDIGYLRDDGCLFLIDRAKQMIRRSSENISPQEIEIVMSQHPAVNDCAVVGVPDPIRGEEILACVIAEEDCVLDPHELFEFCAERLSGFKVPRFIEVWAQFPLTGTLKVRKEKLRDGTSGIIRHDRLA